MAFSAIAHEQGGNAGNTEPLHLRPCGLDLPAVGLRQFIVRRSHTFSRGRNSDRLEDVADLGQTANVPSIHIARMLDRLECFELPGGFSDAHGNQAAESNMPPVLPKTRVR